MLEPCNACGRCLDREASNVHHLKKMRSVSLIRCLPKMSPSSSTSTGSQIATWRRSLTWTRHEFSYDLRPPSTGKMFIWPPAFLSEPGLARYSSAPSLITVWSNYLTSYNDFFEVCITKMVTLSPSVQTVLWPVYFSGCKSRDQSFFVLIGQSSSANAYRYGDHKYVNIHRHQLFIFTEINVGWSMTATVL